jgi:hypothetical protein
MNMALATIFSPLDDIMTVLIALVVMGIFLGVPVLLIVLAVRAIDRRRSRRAAEVYCDEFCAEREDQPS